MKLLISGIAGVLVSCIIFTALLVLPFPAALKTFTSTSIPPELQSPLNVQVLISNLTEPLGVGSEGTLTVIVTSKHNVSNVIVEFYPLQVSSTWKLGISINGENATNKKYTWNGDLRANVSMIFTLRIKAVEVGYAQIVANASSSPLEGFRCGMVDRVFMLILEDNIQISHEFITPPSQKPFLPPINATTNSP